MHNLLYQYVWIFTLYIYCLQDESTHFGLRVLGPKNHTRKIDKIHKIFLNTLNIAYKKNQQILGPKI